MELCHQIYANHSIFIQNHTKCLANEVNPDFESPEMTQRADFVHPDLLNRIIFIGAHLPRPMSRGTQTTRQKLILNKPDQGN